MGLFQGKERSIAGGLPPGAKGAEIFTPVEVFKKSLKAKASLIIVYIISVFTFLFVLYMKGTTRTERLVIIILTVAFAFVNYFFGKRPRT